MKNSERVAVATKIYGEDVELVIAVSNAKVANEYLNVQKRADGTGWEFLNVEDFFKAERVSITNEEAYIWDAVMDFDNNRNGFNTLVALAEQNMPLTDEVLDEQHTYTPENVVGAKSFMEFIQFVRANEAIYANMLNICKERAFDKGIAGETSFDMIQVNGEDGINLADGEHFMVRFPGASKVQAGKVVRTEIGGYILCVFDGGGYDYLPKGGTITPISMESHPSSKSIIEALDKKAEKLMKSQEDYFLERADIYIKAGERAEAKATKLATKVLNQKLSALKKAQKNGALEYTEAKGKNPQNYRLGEHNATTLEELAEMVTLEEVTEAFENRQKEIAKEKEGIVEQIKAMVLDTQEAVAKAVELVNKNKLTQEQRKEVSDMIKKAKTSLVEKSKKEKATTEETVEVKAKAKAEAKAEEEPVAEVVEVPTAEQPTTSKRKRK